MKKRSIKKILIPIILLVVLSVLGVLFIPKWLSENRKQTGDQWMEKQQRYVNDFEEFSKSVDAVFGAYIAGAVTEDTFKSDIDVLNGELFLMQMNYEQDLREHPIKTETVSELMCSIAYDVYQCFVAFQAMLADGYNHSSSPEEVYYVYMAYENELAGYMNDYKVKSEFLTMWEASGGNLEIPAELQSVTNANGQPSDVNAQGLDVQTPASASDTMDTQQQMPEETSLSVSEQPVTESVLPQETNSISQNTNPTELSTTTPVTNPEEIPSTDTSAELYTGPTVQWGE